MKILSGRLDQSDYGMEEEFSVALDLGKEGHSRFSDNLVHEFS